MKSRISNNLEEEKNFKLETLQENPLFPREKKL